MKRGKKPEVTDRLIGFLSSPAAQAVCKVFIGLLFIISSVTKIPDPVRFSDLIANYRLFPDFLLMPAAVIIPWVQLIAGIMILLDIYASSSAFILSGLLAVYIAAIASAWVRGIDIECGCFDLLTQFGLEERVGIEAIIRDLVFLLFPLNVLLFGKNGLNFHGLALIFRKRK